MFRKLNLVIDDSIKTKINYLKKFINKGNVLYRDDTVNFHFKQYPDGTDEKKLFDQYIDKYTIYKQVDFPLKNIIDILPTDFLQKEVPKIHWQLFDGGSLVPPHIDKGRISAINIYVETNHEKTIVYNKLRNGCRLETINGITTNESFIPEWLEQTGSFESNDWDVYLLDVSSPHAVINMSKKQRISISFSFYRTSFEELDSKCLKN